MILAIILRDRSGSWCLNGRRRTRDWSGRRTVAVRWTRIELVVIMDWLFLRNEAESRLLQTGILFLIPPGTRQRLDEFLRAKLNSLRQFVPFNGVLEKRNDSPIGL
jgi:hypothetical protein